MKRSVPLALTTALGAVGWLPAATTAHAQAYHIVTLGSFNGADGRRPDAAPTLSGNTLYGTTVSGGANDGGAVYSLPVTGGTPSLLASINGTAGHGPVGGVVLGGGVLYGTTVGGGTTAGPDTTGDGTVFSLPVGGVGGGAPTILANFSGTDGRDPSAGLTLSADGQTLYGTTFYSAFTGATQTDQGVVFSVPVGGGAPTVLADFTGADGAYPQGDLTLSGGALYGTTIGGGATTGDGTVFSVPVGGGAPTVLASFSNTDGSAPAAPLTLIGNTLYGTTFQGGDLTVGGGAGDGVVFSVPLSGGSGAPTILGTFEGSNGANPLSNLTLIDGVLYGTARAGGAVGDGVVFSIPLGGGAITDVADFTGANGASPRGGLTPGADGVLYGTTQSGGDLTLNGGAGDGTVFALVPAPEPSAFAGLALGALGLGGLALKARKRAASQG